MVSKVGNAFTAVLLLLLAVALLIQFGAFDQPLTSGDYENATLTVRDDNGTALATVEARIADTDRKRQVGLSDTESLAPGEGMLFVHDSEATRTYVMREMAFPLDIVFVAADGRITTIHHAPVEPGESGSQLTPYRGPGKYVFEVPRGYTNATGIEVGDTVVIPDGVD
jgi:uncharacterized membrane protein (UPF0127 family)